MIYLEFDNLEDYLQHIRELMPCQTKAGLKTTSAKPTGRSEELHIIGETVFAQSLLVQT